MTQKSTSLEGLLETLNIQNSQKKDIILHSNQLVVENGLARLDYIDKENTTGIPERISLAIMDTANIHMADKLKIPKPYYDRMLQPEHLALFDSTLNHWLQNLDKKILIRTFYDKKNQKGLLRAMLSDRFKVIDNYDVLFAALEAVKDSGVNLKIETCDLSEKRMYVRFIAPEVRAESKKLIQYYRPNGIDNSGNFGISAGFIISNSEVGFGKYSIAARAIVGACNNGIIFEEDGFGQVHLGARLEEGCVDWSDETKRLNRELIIAQTSDAIKKYISPEYLGQKIKKIEDNNRPLQHPVEAIANVTKELQLNSDKQKEILDFFIKSGDSTAFGLSQSLTYYAHETNDAEEQYDLEAAAMNVFFNISKYDFSKS